MRVATAAGRRDGRHKYRRRCGRRHARLGKNGFSVDASVRITLIDRDLPSSFQSLEKIHSHNTLRIAWAKLIARVEEEFPMQCPSRGGGAV